VREPALLTLVDPEAAQQAIQAGVGSTVISQWAASGYAFCRPVGLDGYVKTIADGRYRYTGNQFTGMEVNLGRTAVLVDGGVHLLVSERKGMTIDPALYRSVAWSRARRAS